jgi:antitoxin HicB
MLVYPAIFTQDDNTIMVTFPDIEDAFTCGDDYDDALFMANDVLPFVIQHIYFEDGKTIPMPSPVQEGQVSIALDETASMKVMLHNEMIKQHVIKAELARRMNIAPQHIKRLLSPKMPTKLSTLSAAFAALGKRLDIRVV